MSVRLGRYEVRAKIAEGGMATIYLGRVVSDAGFGRPVALKVIKDEFCVNREFVNMFLDEAKIVSRLDHQNVVQLIELGKEGHRLFIAMELLMGQSLWSVWDACRERNLRLRYDVVSWIGARVAEGLHHAHELRDAKGEFVNLVHRDVNASNIFITYDGQVKVVDFGLAKAAGRISRTAAGIVKGKLAYMSPEQTVGRPLDRRTDVFALGATLWELTVDRRLFKGKDDVSTLTAVNQAKVPDPTKLVAEYPTALWKVLRTALERDKERRFPTALEMAKALDECSGLEGRKVGAETIAEVMEALFDHERRRMAAWVAATVPDDEPIQRARPSGRSSGREKLPSGEDIGRERRASSDKMEASPPMPKLKPVAGEEAGSARPNSGGSARSTMEAAKPRSTRSGDKPDASPRGGVKLDASTRSGVKSDEAARNGKPDTPHFPSHGASVRRSVAAEEAGKGNTDWRERPSKVKRTPEDKSLPRAIAPRRVSTSTPPPGAFAPAARRSASLEIQGNESNESPDDDASMSSQIGPSTVQRAMGGDASCATFSLKFSYFDLDELAAVLVGLGAVAVAIATAALILWDR